MAQIGAGYQGDGTSRGLPGARSPRTPLRSVLRFTGGNHECKFEVVFVRAGPQVDPVLTAPS